MSASGWIWIKMRSWAAGWVKVCGTYVSAGVRRWAAVSGCGRSYCRINQLAPVLEQAHHTPITQVAAVIQFDGIWLQLQVPTGTLKTDRRHRQRQQHKGKRMVRLLALGLWADGSSRREILDWE